MPSTKSDKSSKKRKEDEVEEVAPIEQEDKKAKLNKLKPKVASRTIHPDFDDDEFDSENEEDESGDSSSNDEEEGENDEDQEDDEDDDNLSAQMSNLEVYLPGVAMDKDEELTVDKSTYEMLHAMNVEWPCLSFDILKDGLGEGRTGFPMAAYIAAGSQADTHEENKIYVMKMSNLRKTKGDDESDGESDEEDEGEKDAVLEYKTIPHEGSVNRLRALEYQSHHLVATMAESGKVYITDITSHVASFDTPGLIPPRDAKPIHTITNHGAYEGYGIDWSPTTVGNLLTGDGKGRVFLTRKNNTGFMTEKEAFTGHKSSIEDIQWSPSQASVFATCSADQTVCIWDLRTKNKAQLSIHAHDTDVNVISWNGKVDYLLASGSDSGTFSIWDLRTWPAASKSKKRPETAASFSWHSKAISSLQWHPEESSVIAVSGADDQVTIWDLALERDEEDEVLKGRNAEGKEVEVPPQLLFVHQGQKSVKEVRWHRQAPGVLMTTAYDGFNVFKTFNM